MSARARAPLALALTAAAVAGCDRVPVATHSAKGDAAKGRVLYVAPDGSDRARGSASKPLRTLQAAADRARPGTTVEIRPGRYEGFRMTRSGRPGTPITFAGAAGSRRPVIAGGPDHPDVIELVDVRHVRLHRIAVTGAQTRWNSGVRIERAANISIRNSTLTGNRSFGLKATDARRVSIVGNRIGHNETGLEFVGGVAGSQVTRNDIFDNDRPIISDPAPNNDRGSSAINFYKATGPITVSANRIWGNGSATMDWGRDGSAFEVYASSKLRFRGNRLWDNHNVMETGTDGTRRPCDRNRFVLNVAFAKSHAVPSKGLILRCASQMTVANNTFYDLDDFAYDITATGPYAGSIEGLRIQNNIAVSGRDKTMSIDSQLPASVSIDFNLMFNGADGLLAYVAGRGATSDFAKFREWTGYEQHGLSAAPRFRNPGSANFRLRRGSPAIGRGTPLRGVTPRDDSTPDLGRFQRRR